MKRYFLILGLMALALAPTIAYAMPDEPNRPQPVVVNQYDHSVHMAHLKTSYTTIRPSNDGSRLWKITHMPGGRMVHRQLPLVDGSAPTSASYTAVYYYCTGNTLLDSNDKKPKVGDNWVHPSKKTHGGGIAIFSCTGKASIGDPCVSAGQTGCCVDGAQLRACVCTYCGGPHGNGLCWLPTGY